MGPLNSTPARRWLIKVAIALTGWFGLALLWPHTPLVDLPERAQVVIVFVWVIVLGVTAAWIGREPKDEGH